MRRRKRKGNALTLVAYVVVLIASIAGLGYAAYQNYGKAVADKQGCFSGVLQDQTLVLVDASEPRFDPDQSRSLHRYFKKLYDGLKFNEKLSVFTTEGDQVGSVLSPRFHICGQAKSPEQLTTINAETGSAGFIKKQRERLYDRRLRPELEALFSDSPDAERRQSHQSPMLEMVADLSRSPALKYGTKVVLISDLAQNSDSVQFCRVKNDMPPFSIFKQKRVYQDRLKPQ